MRAETDYRPAVKSNLSALWLLYTGDAVEEGGFAAAIGADDAEDLSAINLESDVVDRAQAAELLDHTLDLEQRLASLGHLPAGRRVPAIPLFHLDLVLPQDLVGEVFRLLFLQAVERFRLTPDAGPQALRPHQHHADQEHREDEQPPVGELAQDLGHRHHHQRPHDHPGQAADATEDDDDQNQHR